MLTNADCLCRNNQVVEEWLVRDQAGMALQFGLDPFAFGNELGEKKVEAYKVGNDAMTKRWADPHGLTILGNEGRANRIMDTDDAIWNDKNLNAMAENFVRTVRLEGPSGHLSYGRFRPGNLFYGILASIPDGRFEPHHIIVQQEEEKAIRVALWGSFCGTHKGRGRYGTPSGFLWHYLAFHILTPSRDDRK
jgi:hypothetical protein